MGPPREALLAEPFDVAAISERVAAHRGVQLRSAVRFAWVNDGALQRRLEAADTPSATTSVGSWYEFGFAGVGESVSAALPALLAKGLSGLYEHRTKLVLIPRRDDRTEQARAWTLVHEIEHALQDQTSPPLPTPQNGDEALALRALREGDAEITAAAFIASRRLSFDHWLAGLLADEREGSPRLGVFDTVPDFVRRQWLFPYVDGTLLVGSLYRAGGYALVDRMFEHPPVSTEQVMHPEKYLAGELPVPVPIPLAPEGYLVVATGRMGELRTRGLLAPCNRTDIDDTLSGWGGDAYAVVTDREKSHALLWNTIWDDEASARRFELILRVRDACVRDRLGESLAQGPAIIVGDGDRVAYLRGLPADSSSTTAQALLAVSIERPVADPPFGEVRLPPMADPRSFVGKGSLRGNRYVSDPLGLSVSVQGFDVVATTPVDEVTLEEWYGFSRLRLTVSALLTSWTPDLEERMAWNFIGGLEDAGVPMMYLPPTGIATGAGPGRALRWSRGEGTNDAILLVPVCHGKITIAIYADGGGSGVWNEIQRAARHLRFDDASPACRFVTEDTPPFAHG